MINQQIAALSFKQEYHFLFYGGQIELHSGKIIHLKILSLMN